ncbi:Endonuclease/exonuclease/phosphatase superfamily, partial [Sesbania bispinosa]
MNCRFEKVARLIGGSLGKFEGWDASVEGSMGKFMRIGVNVDLRHVMKSFPEIEDELEIESLPYEDWMRASPIRAIRMSKAGISKVNGLSARNLFQNAEISSSSEVGIKKSNTEHFVDSDKRKDTHQEEEMGPQKKNKKDIDEEAVLESQDCPQQWEPTRWWNEVVDLPLKSFSSNHIHVECLDDDHDIISISGLYGHPEEQTKHLTYQLVTSLAHEAREKWICFGDFNDENKGVKTTLNSQLHEFRDCLQLCGYKGKKYTWSNGREGDALIEERLERCCATSEAQNYFQSFSVLHLGRMTSDHAPLRISCRKSLEEVADRKD